MEGVAVDTKARRDQRGRAAQFMYLALELYRVDPEAFERAMIAVAKMAPRRNR